MFIKDLMDMTGKEKKKQQRIHNAKTLAAGVGIAAAAGAAAGILLAPKSGKETRADIMNKAEDCVDTTKDMVHKKVETVKDSASHAAHEISDVIKDAQGKKAAVNKDIRNGRHEVARDVHMTSEKVSEDLKNSDK
jgi:gas vesicle protein